jgi:LuxR family maltose regulon positive regulatory protein
LPAPIIAAKLFVPPARPKFIRRVRLLERLDEGLDLHRKVTLVSAPAGYGKTTLISEWANYRRGDSAMIDTAGHSFQPSQIAWLSLDEGDNDPGRFLNYLIAALQTIAPAIGVAASQLLRSSQPPPIESLLPEMVNDMVASPERCILILDDYHVIETRAVDQALTFLIEHLPPQLHLVITTRADPPLPLPRLRVRGQLTELRAADLRFTPTESALFLNQVMGLSLAEADIAALERRTEGWIAGLQLAALALHGTVSMTGQPDDAAAFIRSFSGSHRFVLDYLVDEVLHQQPEHVRDFLLRTAVLDRLCGPLCDAVTGGQDSQAVLETLERDNLFMTPLDNQRRWYRYHNLFADVLRVRATAEQPRQLGTLHQRASEWYAQNDMPADAIRHALAARDFERAAGLLEQLRPVMEAGYESAAWLDWVKQLPVELVRARPVLCVGFAWAYLDVGELERCEAWLETAEQWLDKPADMPPPGMVVVDHAQFQTLPASIAAARAYRNLARGDVPGTVRCARRVLELMPEGDHQWRRAALALLGLTHWRSGELEAADQAFADLTTSMLAIGNIPDAISTTYVLADIRFTLGRLTAAESACQHCLQFAITPGEPFPVGTSDLYRGLSEIYREWGELEAAEQHLQSGEKLGRQTALTDWRRRLAVTQARLQQTAGDLPTALDLLNEAERLAIKTPLPDVRPVAAARARVWVAQGRLNNALGWVRAQGLTVEDDLSYLREFEHITLARLLIAQYKYDRVDDIIHQAVRLLDRLLAAAEAGGRQGSVIEILVLQALAQQAWGASAAAAAPLARALALAEPEGYVRMFADEGAAMAELLGKVNAEGGPRQAYIQKLLAAFGAEENRPLSVTPQPLIEPLSDRELEVLQLLKTELSGPQIARELMVSVNTIRTHTKNIYSKLGVNNRRSAVRRAGELRLL